VAEINADAGRDCAHAITCNITDKDQIVDLAKTARDKIGPIRILVGNAGVNPYFGAIQDIPDEAYERTMSANVQSNLWLARAVLDDMKESGGAMMFTASIGAFRASDTLGTYGMSKLALIGLVRNLATEYGPLGIRVNAICPGLVKTDFARALWDDPKTEERLNRQIPLRRLGEPEDFSGLAVFLASDENKYMTGQALTVCGGSSMWA
jgi:NAD(P)-dependent dehydrogenase (short-subunit alcohol dehydrogenase family)